MYCSCDFRGYQNTNDGKTREYCFYSNELFPGCDGSLLRCTVTKGKKELRSYAYTRITNELEGVLYKRHFPIPVAAAEGIRKLFEPSNSCRKARDMYRKGTLIKKVKSVLHESAPHAGEKYCSDTSKRMRRLLESWVLALERIS